MNFLVRFVLITNSIFVYNNVVVAQEITDINSCWNDTYECNIVGQFARDSFANPFFVNIDCDNNKNDLTVHSGARRFIGIKTIILNGCNVTRNDTIGVEHIDDPKSVTHLTIKLFKVKHFQSEHLVKFKFLVFFELINNVFEELIDESFRDINSIENLVILNNNLKVIAPYALATLNNLNNFTIIEPNLSIQLLNFTSCESLKSIQLEVYAYEWQILPLSLEILDISSTKLTFSGKTFSGTEDCVNLTKVTIVNSKFNEFPLFESRSLRILNLTQNNLHQIGENDLPNLEILDISGNNLRVIDSNLLKSMRELRELDAENNLIEKISKIAFDSNKHLEIIKISGNRLRSIQFTEYLAQKSIKIYIDDNPWSCMWVLNVSAEYPTIFAIFHYNKFSNKNKVNVNGLNCLFYDVNGYNVYESSIATTEIIPISSTLPFAENIEISYRRNPKDTALITLIILVVGVVFLFFLLYLHIKCRQDTIEPFYHSLPYDTHQMSDRIDIIRRNLPSTDYEAPIATTNTDLKEDIYEQIPDKYTNYERIPEKFIVHDGFDDVNSVVSYKLAIKNSES